MATIRSQIFDEIHSLRTSGPTPAEMEKLQNSLCNDVVRGRQSTMYRAQRMAEFALYDGDPKLFDSELDHYLAVTPEAIRSAVERYLDIDNRVILDIVPSGVSEAAAADEPSHPEPASPQAPGEPQQPTSPPPQVPAPPPPAGDAAAVIGTPTGQLEQPADPARPTDHDSGPLHT